jgi:alkylated DNA repair dioxygenase AlkB
MNLSNEVFQTVNLDDEHEMYVSLFFDEFNLSGAEFEAIWSLHPREFHILKIHGRSVLTPRWQQAFGKDYRYTGSKNNALPVPDLLKRFHVWCLENIDARLNGLLLNWYDGLDGHYIGAHRDDTRDLLDGSPIVTISLGEERIFRMRPWKQKGFKDLTFRGGEVVVIPWRTNLKWTHEVPYFKKYEGRRISVTLRAYK